MIILSFSLKIDKYCTIELSHKGEHFLSHLFEMHDKDRDDCLSPVELKSLFSMCIDEPQLLRTCLYNTNHKVIANLKYIIYKIDSFIKINIEEYF